MVYMVYIWCLQTESIPLEMYVNHTAKQCIILNCCMYFFVPPLIHVEKSYCSEFLQTLSSVTIFICRKKTNYSLLVH